MKIYKKIVRVNKLHGLTSHFDALSQVNYHYKKLPSQYIT